MDTSPRFLPPGLPEDAAPKDLSDRVLDTLWHTRFRRIRGWMVFAFLALVAIIVYAITQWTLVWYEVAGSSFVEFLRLAVSDPDIIFANTKEYIFGLLEALPLGTLLIVFSSAFCLLGLAVLLSALRHLRRAPHPHHPLPSTNI